MHQGIVRYRSISLGQLLHDLYWCISSQNLLTTSPPEFKGELMQSLALRESQDDFDQWFRNLKEDPALLLAFFANDDQLILGKYFERLLLFFFENSHQYRVIYSGKQLFENERTIGELDFVIEDRRSKDRIHIEAAVKYYMGYRNTSKHSMWIGPNGMDTLAKKIEKFEKQLALSELEEITKQININRREVLLKGYFFKHWKATELPYFHNAEKEDCCWMYEDEMKEFIDDEAIYAIIPKNKWLGFYIDETLSFHNGREIRSLIDRQIKLIGKGIMIARIDPATMKVIGKYIVAPLKWPRL